MFAGRAAMSLSTSSRACGVGKTCGSAAPISIAMPPRRPAAMMIERRESRSVLP